MPLPDPENHMMRQVHPPNVSNSPANSLRLAHFFHILFKKEKSSSTWGAVLGFLGTDLSK